MLNIVINGACGRMGRMIADVAQTDNNINIVAGVDKFAAGATMSFPLFENLKDVNAGADVIVDFSKAEALPDVLDYCRRTGAACILATTAYSPAEEAMVKEAAKTISVFRTANMSLGINLMLDLVGKAAAFLPDFDIEIVEAHHKAKVDAPSGTALMIANAINDSVNVDKEYVYGRHHKSQLRTKEEIGIHALRGGSVAGDHKVYFMGMEETLEVSHSAQSRAVFARGALAAAYYMQGREPGLYSMRDLLLESMAVTHVYTYTDQALISLDMKACEIPCLLKTIGDNKINIDMISQSRAKNGISELSISVDAVNAERARDIIGKFGKTQLICPAGKISIEGQGMERQSGVAGRAISCVSQEGIEPYIITTSETRIDMCIPVESVTTAAKAVKTAFGLNK
ncbi:MAG: 4-hydroxy-tetrahydrodipicolinate reductase [Clostridia bacterium]|nr:4-hydroxy-tetrahydrodipicolinate reductase [Clostridia bacterium]